MKTITLTEKQVQQLQYALSLISTSCQEGADGTWDCNSEEGRDGFNYLINELDFVAKTLDIEIEKVEF